MMLPFDLSPLAALWMAAVILVASFVRGYSGFGFAALIVAGAGLVTHPLYAVPVVVLGDLVLTATQLPGIWHQIDRRRVLGLLVGALVGVPIGVWLLALAGVDLGRIAISLFILAMCLVLWRGWRITRRPGALAHGGVGVISGLAQGAALGGLPVAAFLTAQDLSPARFRATVIGYFCLLDIWTLPVLLQQGAVTGDSLRAAAFSLPVMLVGLWLGSRRFHRASPESFRRYAIVLLALLALVGLSNALM